MTCPKVLENVGRRRKKDNHNPTASDGAVASTWPALSSSIRDITAATTGSTLPFHSQLLDRQLALDYGIMLKVLVAFVVLTGCCCWAARIRRQEDGEFWWLKKDVEPKNDEPLVEVKINSPEEPKLASIKQGNLNDLFSFLKLLTKNFLIHSKQKVKSIRPLWLRF